MAEISVRDGQMVTALVREYNQLAALVNEMRTDYIALLAKLDADAGVTDTNYAATLTIAAPVADTIKRNW